eukprot:TRINITY_DN29591_c0_g1_i1.p1 TRINITY_DN29591_c0_g1~~TRINITY_DN29591_c0_g1_i1.p1  ORF type:complete len:471 (+),score=154.62 TRINITY_DN29591_c0_g1_i1:116-1528(+)
MSSWRAEHGVVLPPIPARRSSVAFTAVSKPAPGLVETQAAALNREAMRLCECGDYAGGRALLGEVRGMLPQLPSKKTRQRMESATFNNLGCLEKKVGDLDAAARHLERALRLEYQVSEPSPSTVLNLTAVLQAQGSYNKARDMARLCVELLQHAPGDHLAVVWVAAWHNLAVAQMHATTRAEPEETVWGYFTHASKLAQRHLGQKHPLSLAVAESWRCAKQVWQKRLRCRQQLAAERRPRSGRAYPLAPQPVPRGRQLPRKLPALDPKASDAAPAAVSVPQRQQERPDEAAAVAALAELSAAAPAASTSAGLFSSWDPLPEPSWWPAAASSASVTAKVPKPPAAPRSSITKPRPQPSAPPPPSSKPPPPPPAPTPPAPAAAPAPPAQTPPAPVRSSGLSLLRRSMSATTSRAMCLLHAARRGDVAATTPLPYKFLPMKALSLMANFTWREDCPSLWAILDASQKTRGPPQ